MLGVWEDRNAATDCDLSQAAIRRTIRLTPGTYYFGATFNAAYQLSDEAYMFATRGDAEDLQTADIPAKSIAWARLNTAPNDGSWWGITFIIEEEQDVTLGFQANLLMGSSTQEFRATRLQLLRYDESQIVDMKDVTLPFLYERSNFSRLDENVTTRFATPKYWQVENFKIPNGTDGVKNGIDNYPGYDCLMLGVWQDRSNNQEGSLADARIYRKLYLEPGTYTLKVKFQTSYSMTSSAYLFAATELMPTRQLARNSLAKLSLNSVGVEDERWRSITFTTDTPQDIYVGWQASLNTGSETQEFRVKELQMLYSPKQGGDAVSSVKTDLVSGEDHLYNLTGQKLGKEPHRGIYIKNGRKILKP